MEKLIYLVKDKASDIKLLFLNDSIIIHNAIIEAQKAIRLVSDINIKSEKINEEQIQEKKGIVLATFNDISFLKDLFLSDYKYLLNSDGFAVRRQGNIIYIFSHEINSLFFAIHDFLESNIQILWSRGKIGEECSYIRQEEIPLKICNYCKKSPFMVRAAHTGGKGNLGSQLDLPTMIFMAKNKINYKYSNFDNSFAEYGVKQFFISTIKEHRIESYINSYPNYFMTNGDNKPKSAKYDSYINYYSRDAAKLISDRIIYMLDCGQNKCNRLIDLPIPDDEYFKVVVDGVNLSKEPFICDDGTVVNPEEYNYKSTVYYNYVNRIIDLVEKNYPGLKYTTLAYVYTEPCPKIKVRSNLSVVIAPIAANEHIDFLSDKTPEAIKCKENIINWTKNATSVYMYNYWQCAYSGNIYSRPIAKVIQNNLKWYVEIGVKGIVPEGTLDEANTLGSDDKFDMNEMYGWIMYRLMFNPNDNIDDLIDRFCTIVYGNAKKQMRKYYKLIQTGWDNSNDYVNYATSGDVYIGQMIIAAGIANEVINTLKNALLEDLSMVQRRKIQKMYDILNIQINLYSKRKNEEAFMVYCDKGVNSILSDKMLAVEENRNSVWNSAIRLKIFKDYRTFEDVNPKIRLNMRILYDENYIYFGYQMFDETISNAPLKYNFVGIPMFTKEDGKLGYAYIENYVGANILNMSEYFGFITGMRHNRGPLVYVNHTTPELVDTPKDFKEKIFIHYENDRTKRYYFHVQAISFNSLGTTCESSRIFGSFLCENDTYGMFGWKGNGLWCKSNFVEYKKIRKGK